MTVPRLCLQIGGDGKGHEACGRDDGAGAEKKLPATTTHGRRARSRAGGNGVQGTDSGVLGVDGQGVQRLFHTVETRLQTPDRRRVVPHVRSGAGECRLQALQFGGVPSKRLLIHADLTVDHVQIAANLDQVGEHDVELAVRGVHREMDLVEPSVGVNLVDSYEAQRTHEGGHGRGNRRHGDPPAAVPL